MIAQILFVLVAAFSSRAEASGLVRGTPSETKIEKVTLLKSIQIDDRADSAPLVRVAQALRKKKVAFFWAKVYVTEIFTSELEGLKRESGEAFVESLLQKKKFALRLTFVRNVTPQQTLEGFKDGLSENAVDPENHSIKSVLEAVLKAGENQDGKSLWVVATLDAEGAENVRIQGTSGNIQAIRLPPGTLKDVMKIWLGKPADSGLIDHKKDLLETPTQP